jgi:hypothetical protein
MGGGMLLTATGYVIYIPEPYWRPHRVYGLENRLNILSTFGYVVAIFAVLMLAALVILRARYPGRGAVAGVALAGAALVAIGYVDRLRLDISNYDRATRIQNTVLDKIRGAPRLPDHSTIYVFGVPAETARRVPVFYDTWDLNGAVRVTLDNGTLRAYPVFEGSRFVCADGFLYPDALIAPYARLDDWDGTGKARGITSYVDPWYFEDQGTPYGHALFLDGATGRAAVIRDRRSCESALTQFEPGPFRAPA